MLTASVIIPTFNRAHLIRRALGSVLPQIAAEDEVIVVDDGSSDATEAVVRSLAHPRVRYVRQANAGAGAARNRGVRESQGALVAFLDSDDEWLPGKLELQRRFMAARSDVLFCFTDFTREMGFRQNRSIRYWSGDPRPWAEVFGPAQAYSELARPPEEIGDCETYSGDIYLEEMRRNYILTSCLMARRREAADALHFGESLRTFEDWECFGRLAGRGPAGFLNCETAIQWAHAGPRLTDADLFACAESRLAILEHVWGRDDAFLRNHGDEFRRLVRQQTLLKIRGLLVLGRARQARRVLRQVDGPPAIYRALSRLPGGLLARLLRLRRRLHRDAR
ncbi:MAG TPA: glycosyltransferase family 2 protein [Bryobacteraceae bacterium]|jgi:glycosyltransferase involved in cell wall biosynthesis|nr:glycosyltransferase family 2 protein [Bryobacteraceae bacterium]